MGNRTYRESIPGFTASIGAAVAEPHGRDGGRERATVARELLTFLGLTFGIMYGLGGLGMAFGDLVEAAFGPVSNSNLFVMVLIYAPTISALALMAMGGGWNAVVGLLKRGVSARAPHWWLVSAAAIPLILGGAGIAARVLGRSVVPFDGTAQSSMSFLWFAVTCVPAVLSGEWRSRPAGDRRLAKPITGDA